MGFNVLFPNICINKNDKSIPTSFIALKLMCDDNINDELKIIQAFVSLYIKYIDPNGACFMINISSRRRQLLIQLLDANYYYRVHLGRHRATSGSLTIFSRKKQINQKQPTCWICEQWKSKTTVVSAKGIKLENELVNLNIAIDHKWLFQQLIIPMDSAAREIANLMKDSFSRFKRIMLR